MNLSLGTVLVVAVIALAAPLLVQLAPPLRLPAVVVEIVLGIVVGPSGFDWVQVDVPTDVLALFGLGFLLFLAGLEIDPRQLRGAAARVGLAFAASLALALLAGYAVQLIHETDAPLFVAIALVSTSLGLVVPVLRDAGQTTTVSSGMRFDADALFAEPEHLLLMLAFLVALLVVRGLPALLYRPIVGTRGAVAAGLLQATSLTFLVVAAHLSRELGVLDAAGASALLAAGLLSVVLFPPIALAVLSRTR